MTTTEPTLTVVQLDPRELTVHPRNVRTGMGDLTGLVASIAGQGVIEPLTVVPLQDGWQIVAGHRRAAAAIEAGVERVPCLVRPDLVGSDDETSALHVGAMLAENLHREGLTAIEEARGVQQLLDLGVKLSEVSKLTGLGQKRVKKAICVSRLDDATAAAVVEHQLDLDTAAAIALYADEPETTARLVRVAEHGPGQLAHALEREKQTRQTEAAVAKVVEELRAAGRTVLVGDDSRAQGVTRLWNLKGPAGGELTAEEHKDCPGSVVTVEAIYSGPRVDEACTKPGKYGHEPRWGGPAAKGKPETAEEKEAAKAERRRVIENNKAMQAANVVRREWLKTFLQQRTAPKDLLRFVADSFAIPRLMDTWLGGMSAGAGDSDAHKHLGLERPSYQAERATTLTTGEQVPDARLPVQLFAHVAAANENSISRESWRPNTITGTANTARWLRFLAGQGYTLAEIEQQIVDGAAK